MAKSLFASLVFVFVSSVSAPNYAGELLPYKRFLEKAFSSDFDLKPKSFWVDKELKVALSDYFDYQFNTIRVRYWHHKNTTAWVLDEVAKETPITIGLVVKNSRLELVEVLEHREKKGASVKSSKFVQQFKSAQLLLNADNFELDKPIDGISGATLSVNAVKKAAKVALFLNARITNTELLSQNVSNSEL